MKSSLIDTPSSINLEFNLFDLCDMIKGKGRYQDNQRLEMQSHILLLQYQNTN